MVRRRRFVDSVVVRYCDTSGTRWRELTPLLSALDPETAHMIGQLRRPSDRATALIVHALLRTTAGPGAAGWRFRRYCPQCGSADHGKHVLEHTDGERVEVSISHTEGLAIVAIGSHPLGIDAESCSKKRDWVQLGAQVWSPVELNLLAAGPAELFGYQLWTRKEALGRLIGARLRAALAAVDVLTPLGWLSVGDSQAWVGDIAISTGYTAALASEVEPSKIDVQPVSLAQLLEASAAPRWSRHSLGW